jgi:hypothetical protein
MFQMRSNTMKTCAVGAMVVGGALSMTQTASAGLTWLGSGTVWLGDYDSFNGVYVDGDPYLVDWGNNALLAFSGSAGANVSYFGSATAGPGFSVGFSTNGAPGYIEVVGQRVFEVTGTETLTITLTKGFDADFGGVSASLWKPDGDVVSYGTGTHNVTLSAGTYMLDFAANSLNSAAYSGDFISVVPAPGALALLGAAGLIGSRRRR